MSMSNKQRLLLLSLPCGVLIFICSLLVTERLIEYHPVGAVESASTIVDTPPNESELWLDTNVERQKHGLAPLVIDARLTASATAKCADMVTNNYWAHVSPTGMQWYSFIQQTTTYEKAGENLSRGYATSSAVVNAWIASPEHEANILDPRFAEVGYAICTDPQSRILVVQQFTN